MSNATISQIKVGNTTYDICDVTARNHFEEMITTLLLTKSSNYSITSTPTIFNYNEIAPDQLYEGSLLSEAYPVSDYVWLGVWGWYWGSGHDSDKIVVTRYGLGAAGAIITAYASTTITMTGNASRVRIGVMKKF